jgi:16S rRNA (guanine1516-N2)-methyltransferase
VKCHPDSVGISEGLPLWLEEHAKRFGFSPAGSELSAQDWVLELGENESLSIYREGQRKLKWESSWLELKTIHRLKTLGKQQPLAKAVGVKADLSVWDLTAGWGRDALALAWLGCQVQCAEESPTVCALLLAAHREALRDETLGGAANRIKITCASASAFIDSHAHNRPHVIYLDPMYPSEDRTALPKKELQLLAELARPSEDQEAELPALLEKSLSVARARVVIKRPPKAAAMGRPSHSVDSKLVRYDVYVCG